MGGRVSPITGPAPPKHRQLPCPTCGHLRRVINGHWLRYVRQVAGLDQRRLGKILGVSGPYLSDLESNRRDCPLDVLDGYEQLRKEQR